MSSAWETRRLHYSGIRRTLTLGKEIKDTAYMYRQGHGRPLCREEGRRGGVIGIAHPFPALHTRPTPISLSLTHTHTRTHTHTHSLSGDLLILASNLKRSGNLYSSPLSIYFLTTHSMDNDSRYEYDAHPKTETRVRLPYEHTEYHRRVLV